MALCSNSLVLWLLELMCISSQPVVRVCFKKFGDGVPAVAQCVKDLALPQLAMKVEAVTWNFHML